MNTEESSLKPTASRHPLSGIRVLEMGQLYNGPYAGLLLAMAGADVVKLEPPWGELLRARGSEGGAGHPFAMLNSSKRSIAINLKSEEGRARFDRLASAADVVLDNYAPGALERLGISRSETVSANSDLVWATSNGFGSDSTYRDHLAMDLTVQAMSGAMSVTGYPDNPPVKAGPAICDFLGGAHLYAGIVTALLEREHTGRGQTVEVPMLDAVFPSMMSSLGLLFGERREGPLRTGNRHNGLADAPYNIYRCNDGYAAVICVNDEQWVRLLKVMDRDDLLDAPEFESLPKRAAAVDAVDSIVSEWTEGLSVEVVVSRLSDGRVPCAPVRDLVEVVNDRDMYDRGFLQMATHPEHGEMVLTHSPIVYGGHERTGLTPSPSLGEHTDQVVSEWLGD